MPVYFAQVKTTSLFVRKNKSKYLLPINIQIKVKKFIKTKANKVIKNSMKKTKDSIIR